RSCLLCPDLTPLELYPLSLHDALPIFLVATGITLFFNDRKLYDVAAHGAGEGWPPARAYAQWIRQLLTEIVREGRETGEFERKTPLDETVQAIYLIVLPYVNPLLLQHNLDVAEEA